MIDLNQADEPVRYNYRPKHPAEDPVDDKADTADHIDDPDFPYVFQDKTQYNKKRGGIPDVSCRFRIHEKNLQDHKLNHFQ